MKVKLKALLSVGLILCCSSVYPAFADDVGKQPEPVIDLIPVNGFDLSENKANPAADLIPISGSAASAFHSTVVKNSYVKGNLYIIDKNNSITPYNKIDISNTYIGGDLIIYQYTDSGFTPVSLPETSDFRGFIPVVL